MALTPAKMTRVAQVTSNTGVFSQDFTETGFGDVKGCIILYNAAETNTGQVWPNIRSGYGFASNGAFGNGGVHSVGFSATDTGTQTKTTCSKATSKVIFIAAADIAEANAAEATIEFITDGIRLNFTVNAKLRIVQAILFGGENLSTDVGQFALSDAGGSENLGYAPQAVMFIGNIINSANDVRRAVSYSFSMGWISQGAIESPDGMNWGIASQDGLTGSTQVSSTARVADTIFTDLISNTDAGRAKAVIDGTGFVQQLHSGTVENRYVGFLAFRMEKPQGMWAGRTTYSNGGLTIDGVVPFKASAVFASFVDRNSAGGGFVTTSNASMMTWFFNDQGDKGAVSVRDLDGATAPDNQSSSRGSAMGGYKWNDGTNAIGLSSSGNPTFSDTGFQIVVGNSGIASPDTDDIFFYMAIEAEVSFIAEVYKDGAPLTDITIGGTPVKEVWVGGVQVWG